VPLSLNFLLNISWLLISLLRLLKDSSSRRAARFENGGQKKLLALALLRQLEQIYLWVIGCAENAATEPYFELTSLLSSLLVKIGLN